MDLQGSYDTLFRIPWFLSTLIINISHFIDKTGYIVYGEMGVFYAMCGFGHNKLFIEYINSRKFATKAANDVDEKYLVDYVFMCEMRYLCMYDINYLFYNFWLPMFNLKHYVVNSAHTLILRKSVHDTNKLATVSMIF